MKSSLNLILLFLVFFNYSRAQITEVPLGGFVSNATGSMSYNVGEISNELVQSSSHSGKFGVIQLVEWNQRERLSGSLKYANLAQTPMTNSSLNFTRGNQIYYTANTGGSGNIDLMGVNRGTYNLQFNTNKPWGGVNATDAILINNHFTSINILGGINLKAADVNASGTITSADALQVMQRFVNQRSSFVSGNFVLDDNFFNVIEGIGTANMESRVLSFGDVNGSYVPNTALREEWTDFDLISETVSLGDEVNEIPIFVMSESVPSAVSLSIMLPEGVFVEGVRTSNVLNATSLVFGQEGNNVRVAWYDLSNTRLSNSSVLCYLRVRGARDGEWKVGSATEFADKSGNVQSGINLGLPKLTIPKSALTAYIYPNPSLNKQYLHVSGMRSTVTASLYDFSGKLVKSYPSFLVDLSDVKFDLEVENLSSGSYNLRLESKDSDENLFVKLLKLVRN